MLRESNLRRSCYTPDEFARALQLIAEGEVDAAMVTATVGVDGVAQAFADLANPEVHTKIIVEPWRYMQIYCAPLLRAARAVWRFFARRCSMSSLK